MLDLEFKLDIHATNKPIASLVFNMFVNLSYDKEGSKGNLWNYELIR